MYANFKLTSPKLNNGFNLNHATENKFRLEFLQREFKTSLKVQNKTPKVYLKSPSQKDIQEIRMYLKRSQAIQEKILNQSSLNKIQ